MRGRRPAHQIQPRSAAAEIAGRQRPLVKCGPESETLGVRSGTDEADDDQPSVPFAERRGDGLPLLPNLRLSLHLAKDCDSGQATRACSLPGADSRALGRPLPHRELATSQTRDGARIARSLLRWPELREGVAGACRRVLCGWASARPRACSVGRWGCCAGNARLTAPCERISVAECTGHSRVVFRRKS